MNRFYGVFYSYTMTKLEQPSQTPQQKGPSLGLLQSPRPTQRTNPRWKTECKSKGAYAKECMEYSLG